MPFWPPYQSSPEPLKDWVCVPAFKQTDINPNKSMVVDTMYNNYNTGDFLRPSMEIAHNAAGNPSGINAGFGDGHVNWQAVKVVTDGFDPNCWFAISSPTASAPDYMYIMSCWRP